jgi:hypothetical protein
VHERSAKPSFRKGDRADLAKHLVLSSCVQLCSALPQRFNVLT